MGLLNKLIEQSKNPNGFVGSVMIRIMNRAHSGMTHWALEKIKIGNEAVILDIGCGGGKTINTLSNKSVNSLIFGIDYSDTAVENSIRTNSKDVETGKVKISKASVSSIPFRDNFFDIITAFQTHYFWPDLENDSKRGLSSLKTKWLFFA